MAGKMRQLVEAMCKLALGWLRWLLFTTTTVENRKLLPYQPRAIYFCLADRRKSAHLQPLVKEINVLQESKDQVSFDLVESIPLFCGITFTNKVHVEMTLNSDKGAERIDNKVSGLGLAEHMFSARQSFTFQESEKGTWVVDTMHITTLILLCGWSAKIADKAHKKLLANLEERMASL